MSKKYQASYRSPLGWLELFSDGQKLLTLDFVGKPRRIKSKHSFFRLVGKELREYFSGTRKKFSLPLALDGTAWQNRVWLTLLRVPYGAIISYGDLARVLGRPLGARALGQAVGLNPLPIIIPCHRVLGAGGRLGGYSGGLKKKIWLLRHEGHFDL